MKFYLGIHHTNWLSQTDVPLFVSRRRLKDQKSFHRSAGSWALDSGGFSELSIYDGWKTTVDEFLDDVHRFTEGVGEPDFVSQMDWMCEPIMLEKTGKTIEEHQYLTTENFLELINKEPGMPILPVLQGWALEDYLSHLDLWLEAGIDLWGCGLVGVGSVCRRQKTTEAEEIFTELSDLGLQLHGFGVKVTGLKRYSTALSSSDSMAWSYAARHRPPLPGCAHKNCANCLKYALMWYNQVQSLLSREEECVM